MVYLKYSYVVSVFQHISLAADRVYQLQAKLVVDLFAEMADINVSHIPFVRTENSVYPLSFYQLKSIFAQERKHFKFIIAERYNLIFPYRRLVDVGHR